MEMMSKINFQNNIDQAASTCITSSFTEHALHSTMNQLVPTILMEPNFTQVCLYDCENDILLVSQPKKMCSKGRLSRTGCFFLWLVINHKLFLRTLSQDLLAHKSRIKQVLEEQNHLEFYLQLKGKNVDWTSSHKHKWPLSAHGVVDQVEPKRARSSDWTWSHSDLVSIWLGVILFCLYIHDSSE